MFKNPQMTNHLSLKLTICQYSELIIDDSDKTYVTKLRVGLYNSV